MLVDHTKVHGVNFQGKYFSTRGPLNSGPAPQGQPVIAQAGGSPRGRKFAAAHAETIVAHVKGIEAMKAYRDDVHKHMVAGGRNPDDCKVLFLINPILGETEEEALERRKQAAGASREHIEQRLAHFGKVTNIDFGQFDLDKPLPDHVTTNGHQLNLEQFRAHRQGPLDPRDHGELQQRRPVDRPVRHARLGRRAHGRGHGRGRRRRLPVLDAERQPPHPGRDRGRAGARPAGSRPGAQGSTSTSTSATIFSPIR